MDKKFRVAILGLGGVGGYLGGKLAGHYSGSSAVEILFVARGEHEEAIRSNGLKLITPEGEQITHPFMVTSRAEELGEADMVLCCVKSYDLEKSLEFLKPSVRERTVILPFLNGIDAGARIRSVFPQSPIWEGCVYIISRLIAPGVVKQSGPLNAFYFGSAAAPIERLRELETMFRSAGINVALSGDITQTLWEKYIFISPLATLTSYLDLPIGAIVSDIQHKALLLNLLTELKAVADAKKIPLPENIVQTMLAKMISLPYEASSSMRDDFHNGKRVELESLTGYVAALGSELHIPTPTYDRMLAGLTNKLVRRN